MTDLTHLFKIGENVKYVVNDFDEKRIYDGTVKEVAADHVLVDIPEISDHMWFEEGTCVSFNSVLNYWIHYYIDHTNCSRPVYIMALIRRNYYVTKKLERCYINLR